MGAKFEIIENSAFGTMNLNGEIRLTEGLMNGGQPPILDNTNPTQPQSNRSIAENQAFTVDFFLKIEGSLRSFLRKGKWRLIAHFDKIGAGEVNLNKSTFTKNFDVGTHDELVKAIPFAANTFPSGIYQAAATAQWFDADGKPTPITAVQDLGSFNIYQAPISPIFNPDILNISGTILTPNGVPVADVEVHLSGDKTEVALTNPQGKYQFSNLPKGNYTIRPKKDGDDLNGVTTFDLVLISKHILGIEPLNSPEKILAADINQSGHISTLDMVELRKRILFIDTEFQDIDSWRFFDASFNFSDPKNPFIDNLPEEITISSSSSGSIQANFKGIKMGDVNDSVTPN